MEGHGLISVSHRIRLTCAIRVLVLGSGFRWSLLWNHGIPPEQSHSLRPPEDSRTACFNTDHCHGGRELEEPGVTSGVGSGRESKEAGRSVTSGNRSALSKTYCRIF